MKVKKQQKRRLHKRIVRNAPLFFLKTKWYKVSKKRVKALKKIIPVPLISQDLLAKFRSKVSLLNRRFALPVLVRKKAIMLYNKGRSLSRVQGAYV